MNCTCEIQPKCCNVATFSSSSSARGRTSFASRGAHHDPKCKNWATFRLGHGGAVRGIIPAQAPCEGGEPTMRKGSYSEDLVKNVVATKACSKRREGRITLRRQHVEFEYTLHANVRSHSSFTMGLQRPSQVCAVRGEDLPLSCASWKLDPEPLRNIGFLFRVNSWNVWSQVKNSEGDSLLAALNLNFKPILVQRAMLRCLPCVFN